MIRSSTLASSIARLRQMHALMVTLRVLTVQVKYTWQLSDMSTKSRVWHCTLVRSICDSAGPDTLLLRNRVLMDMFFEP